MSRATLIHPLCIQGEVVQKFRRQAARYCCSSSSSGSSSSSVPYRNVRMARMGNIGHASVKEDKRPEAIFIQDDTLADNDDFPIL